MAICSKCGVVLNDVDVEKHECFIVIPLGKELKQGILSDVKV